MLIILNLVLIGITTSMFLKHLNAILKNFASGMFSIFLFIDRSLIFDRFKRSQNDFNIGLILLWNIWFFIKTRISPKTLFKWLKIVVYRASRKLPKLWNYFSQLLHLLYSSRWLWIYKLQFQSFWYGFHFTFTQLTHFGTRKLSKKIYKAKKYVSSKMVM